MPLKGVATKSFELVDDEWELKENYKSGKWFKGFEAPINNLQEAYNILLENQDHPCFMIHGSIIEGTNKEKMVRRKRSDHPDGLKPTITDRNLSLFCLDVDGWDGTIKEFIKALPEPFQECDYIYQYSSSYGLTSNQLKCHLFFWLKEPAHNLDIREWIKGYGIKAIDPAVLLPAQPVYIQKRICLNAPDPIEDFIGYIDNGHPYLDWKPEVSHQSKNQSKSKTDFDLSSAVEKVLTAEDYHTALNGLALSLANQKVPISAVKAMLKGAMNSATIKDKRWQDRFDDIDRSVDSAFNIVNEPTIEEVLEWIQDEDTLTVKAGYAKKCILLSPMDRTTAIHQIMKKIGYGARDIQKTIKIAEEEYKIKQSEAAKEAKSKERESRGIYEFELSVENSGDVCKNVCKVLAKSSHHPELFVIGGRLASVGMGHPKTIQQCHKSALLGKDYPKMPIIQPYVKPYSSLSYRMKKDVMLVNEKGMDIEPPSTFLNVIGEATSPCFKPLTGIVENPFIDESWKLIRKTGYDDTTGLYAVLHHKLKITKMNPEKAYEYLANEVFAEFPFSSDLDRAVAVSAMLTAVQRPTICGDSGFPGYGIVSPVQSSGKTTMAQLISYSVFNRPVAATTLPDDEVELGKHLLAILQEGHSCVLFDNIDQGDTVTSNVLSRAMSNDLFSGRQLGENKNVEVPSSVVWLFTGNGIKFVGDFATRIYPININAKMEDPNVRVFKREDIGQWAMDHRKKTMSAILSIIIAGKGVQAPDSTRFKGWDKFVRRPILKVAGIDINDAVKKNQQEDPIKLGKAHFLNQLKETFGSSKFTTKDIIKKAYGAFESGETPLSEAIDDILGEKGKSTRTLGRYLSTMVDVVFHSLMLSKETSNVVYWKIMLIGEI